MSTTSASQTLWRFNCFWAPRRALTERSLSGLTALVSSINVEWNPHVLRLESERRHRQGQRADWTVDTIQSTSGLRNPCWAARLRSLTCVSAVAAAPCAVTEPHFPPASVIKNEKLHEEKVAGDGCRGLEETVTSETIEVDLIACSLSRPGL